jgi:hypothetical protein
MGMARGDDRPIGRRRDRSAAEPDGTPEQLPRLGSQLPLEKRRQVAQQVGHLLLQRLRSLAAPTEEKSCADSDAVR